MLSYLVVELYYLHTKFNLLLYELTVSSLVVSFFFKLLKFTLMLK